MRRRFQRLAAIVAFVGLVSHAAEVAFGALFAARAQLLWSLTGRSLLPWQIAGLSLLELFGLLVLCWGVPETVFRWLILPHCPQCAARMNLLTESGIQYVCRRCGHCHDTGTMKSLADAERKPAHVPQLTEEATEEAPAPPVSTKS